MQRAGNRFVPRVWGVRRSRRHVGQGEGVELWIRQDIMGDHRSFHVLVAEPRFLLVKGHTAAGVIQFCVCHRPDSTGEAEVLACWRRLAKLIRERMSGLFAVGGALRCQCAGGIDCVAGHWRPGPRIGRTQLARNSIRCCWNGTFVCQRRCQARTTTQPSLLERGVPGLGGTGVIASLFLGSGSPV